MPLAKRLLRLWAYFRRGHNIYLVFIISFANFVVIQYRLLVEHVSFLKDFFPTLTSFFIAFVAIYIPTPFFSAGSTTESSRFRSKPSFYRGPTLGLGISHTLSTS